MKSGHLEVVRSDGVEKRGPAVPCKWSVTGLWLVGCLASRLSPGLWLVTCLISIKTASTSWRPIGFRSESWPLILVSCLVSVASSRSPGLWLVSPGYLCHRGRGGRSWRLFAWSSASESLVLTTFCCCCCSFVTIITAFRSLARRGWVRGCREQILCHGNYIDAWDPTPWLLWSCWWSPVVLPCISCDSKTW